jgi:hypothetical protein
MVNGELLMVNGYSIFRFDYKKGQTLQVCPYEKPPRFPKPQRFQRIQTTLTYMLIPIRVQ